MGVLWSPESDFARESVKWEQDYSQYGPPGRPRVFEEFPKMLYLAGRNSQGVPRIVESVTVQTADQQANYESRGFREGQDKALEALHAMDREIATLAANRAFNDRKLSPRAQAEAAAADELTSQHLPEIPAVPIKPRASARKAVS